jgi:toxin ParE1/3/4
VTIRYTPGALKDLSDIAEYLRPRSPAGAKRVGAAIDASVKMLTRYPLSGRAQDFPGVRKTVVQPWNYLIYYRIDAEESGIVVLPVVHPARARPFKDG